MSETNNGTDARPLGLCVKCGKEVVAGQCGYTWADLKARKPLHDKCNPALTFGMRMAAKARREMTGRDCTHSLASVDGFCSSCGTYTGDES